MMIRLGDADEANPAFSFLCAADSDDGYIAIAVVNGPAMGGLFERASVSLTKAEFMALVSYGTELFANTHTRDDEPVEDPYNLLEDWVGETWPPKPDSKKLAPLRDAEAGEQANGG